MAAPTASAPAKNEELQEHAHLIRTVEAALKIAVPDDVELRFRGSLLRLTTSSLAKFKQSLVVRLFEAACDVKFPSADVTEFRHALEVQLGERLQLRSFRSPATTRSKPQPAR